jgi:uncharacterized protein YutE (UPF0331/DUF86 family)
MSKTFTAFQVAHIVYDVGMSMVNNESWIPEKDKKFIEYLHKLGVLDAWEEVHGKIAKKYRPKNYEDDKK